MRRNRLRELLRAGRPSIGTHVHSAWPAVVELVGHTGLFDYVEFVGEYAPYDLFALENLARAVDTFDHLADVIEKFTEKLGLQKYTLYVQDYGAPVGYRLAVKHPDRVQALVVQNGNAYDEGIDNDFWEPIKAYWREKTAERERPLRGFLNREATIWQYTHGVRDTEAVSPDNWNVDQPLLDRPGNAEIQLALFHSYGSNPPLYPKWQAYFRTHQPPTLVVWGKNDQIFPAAGAEPYKKDLTNLEFHLLDTGHFALEEDADKIADLMRNFLRNNVKR